MTTRLDVEFEVEGNERLRAWLYVPDTPTGSLPAVSMAHGYAGTREHGLDRLARAFAEAGFVALWHDRRNFGASDGAVRLDVDP
ncbi:alpha/beta hydrolase [Paraburkholderia youngii]|uniref:alpha/beta hydrolase n=1 Tax=Paraburkholderia youngii TaxID=2782701 RepID=UPI003D24E37D